MATAMHVTDASPTRRRQEIEEWHSSLATRTDTEILGVPTGATRAQVKAAFVSLARRFHPNSVAAAEGEMRHRLQAIFVRVTEAYRNLSREKSPDRTLASPAPAASALPDTAARRERVEEALLLARAYAIDARWKRNAVALLSELVEQNPNDAEALAAIGDLYRREGLLSQAESMFVRALAADPGMGAPQEGLRSVRARLVSRQTPSRTKAAPRRGLISRLFSVAR